MSGSYVLPAGKTFRTLLDAARTQGQIICRDQSACDWMANQAKEMGLQIRPPMTADEFWEKFLAR